ncbi:hypothetical protein TraAM80_06870 [Trypanosoma rangeli]|uniref:Uncharacterized protein n=1 Tax=Trypanosoma rangeli TaxID=5698 RepID=A0A422N848_TRYRA|nr:uncharacterized protein TraAM80_06870 [Trypanosoma rangeli]RNF01637.1 hypothetical protein TraAM80_06870 [Trypanosoma rangeli]|eukprot:RNF01637.1 hypothetical protein TraAM80_06870 [Trypanosoma rangeli]
MMRRVLLTRVLHLPLVSSRAAGSFMAGNGNRGSHRQNRERTLNTRPEFHVGDRVVKREMHRAPSSRVARNNTPGTLEKTGVLFPDAQTQELDEMEVADGHTRSTVESRQGQQQDYDDDEEVHAPPNLKRRYDSYARPKRETVVLTSSFANRVTSKGNNDEDDDVEDDVTKIYSHDEVETENGMTTDTRRARSKSVVVANAPSRSSAGELNNDDDNMEDDVAEVYTSPIRSKEPYNVGKMTSVHFTDNEECNMLGRVETHDDEVGQGIESEKEHEADVDEEESECMEGKDEFKNVKNHPFFADLLRRMEKNATRQRQQIKSAGCYSLEAINRCLRPLLQLTDYPFTVRQLHHMAPFLYSNLLRRSLSDLKACRRLHVYRSAETDVILDWSVEDFLRRRYESIHLSWEPVKIVMMRFGWNQEVMTDRDCLLYLSKFRDYIELAELELSAGDDKPKALPIDDAERTAEQRPIPVSKLLIRRKVTEDTEPSVTEAIRLMGTPALSKPAKSRRANVSEKDSVEGTFERIQREASSVDGDEEAKLQHAIDATPFLRQASHPSGRCVREFSLGKGQNTVISESPSAASARLESHSFDEDRRAYTPESYEALANAYHKKKVEASQIRRRLLNTDSIDQASELQEKLAAAQKEIPRLRGQLEKMRQLRRTERADAPGRLPTSLSNAKNYTHAEELSTKGKGATSVDMNAKDIQGEKSALMTSSLFTRLDQAKQQQREQPTKNYDAAEDKLGDEEASDQTAECGAEKCLSAHCNTVSPLKEIEVLSSAALMLRREIESLQEKRRLDEGLLLNKLEEAIHTLLKIEDTIKSVSQREAKEAEQKKLEMQKSEETERQMRREHAEARARALEEELLRKREERVKIIGKQREEARQAQREAELALQRQKQAEQAAVEAEAELERTLQEAKSMIWNEGANEEPKCSGAQTPLTKVAESPTIHETFPQACESASKVVPNTSSNISFSTEPACTPDQYDGLCLGAERLHKEITELERQMENEGDEDDMTLMAVLATSRSDLEELEDFIRVVRRREAWAAERDRIRKEDRERQARERGKHSNDLQEKIDAIRFQILLMEKRLQHATERNIVTKLEQGIINNRREINRLRIEQDRLRRSGHHADASGICIPSSISIAEALAHEEAKDAEVGLDEPEHDAEEVDAAYTQGAADVYETAVEGEGEKNGTDKLESVNDVANATTEEEYDASEDVAADTLNSQAETLEDDQKELQQLTGRMKGILEDIKYLEENIASQEDGDDAKVTAASLAELQKKLRQLLEMRDAIKNRTEQLPLEDPGTNSAPVSWAPAAAVAATSATITTNVKVKATTTVASRRPKVLAPLFNRPVSSHASYAGAEVLRFEHQPKEAQQHASQRGAAAGRKMRRGAKANKARR